MLRALLLAVGLAAAAAAAGYAFNPWGVRDAALGALFGGAPSGAQSSTGSTCEQHDQRCDFMRAVLASTEDVWAAEFAQGRLPDYGVAVTAYEYPTLVVYTGVAENACGGVSAESGPVYCIPERNLYIDPSFYDVLEARLNAPGDFAQAFFIAHEVGHHVQTLIGANALARRGENANQTSVRFELQADCLAGVWAHAAAAVLQIDAADVREGLNATFQIGDDTLQRQAYGAVDERQFMHGSSHQRMRWFRHGWDSGDARACDTFGVLSYAEL